MAVITIVAAVTFITHVYETLFLVKEWQSDRARGERLQRLNVEAELLALQSEVNPHTLFNNLNAAQPPGRASVIRARRRSWPRSPEAIAISCGPDRSGWCPSPTSSRCSISSSRS
jgi:hypothetical protein